MPKHFPVDVVILTILPEEYNAVQKKIEKPQKPQLKTNLYAWKVGKIGTYTVAVGMTGRATNVNSSQATSDAIDCFDPQYVFLVGIAGGLKEVEKGNVVIADIIYGYEYGKSEQKFTPRANFTYRTDIGLLNMATAHSLEDIWRELISEKPPEESNPKILKGEVASGEKIVDDPTNEFFKEALTHFPKAIAVEMEGFGAANAIETATAKDKLVHFLMIRGISDLPRPEEQVETKENTFQKGTAERDAWKKYASETAAAFTASLIKSGLPKPPRTNSEDPG